MDKYKVIDLFAGAGGLSTGFEMAGFETILAIEIDLWASETYSFNHPKTPIYTGDITKLTNLNDLIKDNIDGIIGGPPCQGFSLSGNRDPKDPRNSLFMEFVRFIRFYKPNFFLMENVPGLLSMKNAKGEKVIDIIKNEFENSGYDVDVSILDSSDFGVPQKRLRVFIVGFKKELNLSKLNYYPKPFTAKEHQKLSIRDAISDLPPIEAGQGEEKMSYYTDPANDFQKMMRANSVEVYNHIAMRHTQRIINRFKTIKEGQSLADVSEEHMQRKRGDATRISGKTFSQNNMRPNADKPAPTIAASFQGNFIHPWLNRNFTAREAARLQSFPDNYIFKGKRTTMSWEKNLSQYQQIGNAVPPLFAKSIAKRISNILDSLN